MVQRIGRVNADFESPPLGVQIDTARQRQIEPERSRTGNGIPASVAELPALIEKEFC